MGSKVYCRRCGVCYSEETTPVKVGVGGGDFVGKGLGDLKQRATVVVAEDG